MNKGKIISSEQIRFPKGKSTIDHCLTLAFLANKYLKSKGENLYAAFIDLKSAFDSIPRDLLWGKPKTVGMEPHLLYLIKKLHNITSGVVKMSPDGQLSSSFPITKGVK